MRLEVRTNLPGLGEAGKPVSVRAIKLGAIPLACRDTAE